MDKKIEELNLKYQNLLEDSDNYNNQFTKHLQNFYQYAIEAGDGDFQKGIQATKKFKKMIESLQESAKLSNQYIVKEAYDSIVILLLTLLRSTRWQDNNAGIQIIICYLESNIYLKMDKISQVFKFNLTKYFEYPEEILLENTSKLLTLLMNSNDIFNKEEYLEIQNKLIQSIHSSLILTENYQDYLQTITNLLSQNPNSLLGLKYKNSNICTQERYQSKIQLAPLLQILKEISLKTQLFNYQDLLIKCCMVNQKQTQLTAFNMLNDAIDIESIDINQVIINSLSHNNFEIRKIGILLATKKFGKNNGNMIQEVRLLIYLNSELFEKSQQNILLNYILEQQKKFENENFVLIANICSLQVQSENELIKQQSWRNLYRIYNKQENKQDIQYENQIITSQIIQLITKFNLEHNDPKTFYYYQHFINKIVQFVQDQDKQILIDTVCKFIGKQNSNNGILKQIFIQLDMSREDLIKNKYYNIQEWDTFLKDYDTFYQESKQKKLGEMSNKK